MNFVKFTTYLTGNNCYIDKYSIIAVVEVNIPPTTPYTLVHFGKDRTVQVSETPDQVISKIQESIDEEVLKSGI